MLERPCVCAAPCFTIVRCVHSHAKRVCSSDARHQLSSTMDIVNQ